MASDSMDRSDSLSGLTATEAKAVHSLFVRGFLLFTFWAFIIHMIVWYYKPWIGVIA